MKGIVSEITSFSTHDGPGIRTTVFMKGCPLRCRWCSNPETWENRLYLYYMAGKCRDCKTCGEICPEQAINPAEKGFRRIDRQACSLCMKCVDVCMAKAYRQSGEEYTVSRLMERIERERPFYDRDGGVTASGGEALSQWEFVGELFRLCHEERISTVLDTSGYGSRQALERILPHTGLCLLDIKHMDPEIHRKYTGVSNRIILENAKIIASVVPVRISIPLVADVNCTAWNLHATAELAAGLGIRFIDLSPMHSLGAAKYHYLGKNAPYGRFRALEKQEIEDACRLIKGHGLNVTVGRMM